MCVIGDAATGHKVLEYADAFLPPDKFAAAVVALCNLFKDEYGQPAMLCWEMPGPGNLFGDTVKKLGYTRLFYRESQHLTRDSRKSDIPGWHSNAKTKHLLLESYHAALCNRSFINRSKVALEECYHYRHSDRRDAVEHPRDVGGPDPSGARSKHGDRVIGDAQLWMVLRRLGAGKADPVVVEQAKAPVGSLAWRIGLHEQSARSHIDRRPIRRHNSIASGVRRGL